MINQNRLLKHYVEVFTTQVIKIQERSTIKRIKHEHAYIHKTSVSQKLHIPHEGYNLEVTSPASHQQDVAPLLLGFPLLQCCCLWAGCLLLYSMSH